MRYHAGEGGYGQSRASQATRRKMSGVYTGSSAGCGRNAPRTATGSARCGCCTNCARSTSAGAPGWAGGQRTPRSYSLVCVPRLNGLERLSLATKQIRALETTQTHQVRDGEQPSIAMLAQLAGIGTGSAWTLVKELFGWRQFRNRREPPAGWVWRRRPMQAAPVKSSRYQQGGQQAGPVVDGGARRSWLRFQLGSAMSTWFNQRFGSTGKRTRRIGIVGLARRLAIALWRYLEHGEIPAGARLKTAATPAM